MITRSTSLDRRLERETVRHAGSEAKLVFYAGTMPASCEAPANGERVSDKAPDEAFVRAMASGIEPMLPEGAHYWRLYDNGGLVVMQGDGR